MKFFSFLAVVVVASVATTTVNADSASLEHTHNAHDPTPNIVVPTAPGPTLDEPSTLKPEEHNTTLHTAIDDEEKAPRSALFSILFFVASASALVTILYKFPTKKKPQRIYEPMTSA